MNELIFFFFKKKLVSPDSKTRSGFKHPYLIIFFYKKMKIKTKILLD